MVHPQVWPLPLKKPFEKTLLLMSLPHHAREQVAFFPLLREHGVDVLDQLEAGSLHQADGIGTQGSDTTGFYGVFQD